ncbi:MAG: hypothetical protein QNJ35_06830 [Paracoccaceae bacterium]|nr:hypothetical protein [Paracoccaceae bacterium]
MAVPAPRYVIAAALALLLAVYATVFAHRTHNLFDLPTWLDVTEWPATLLFLFAGWSAWVTRERQAAFALVVGMLAFFGAQSSYLFSVPLGFVVVTALALVFLFVLPTTWKPR